MFNKATHPSFGQSPATKYLEDKLDSETLLKLSVT